MHYLMPVVQLYIFLAQWRLVLSESAVITVSHVSYVHMIFSSFTTVITTVTMVHIYSHVVPQDI